MRELLLKNVASGDKKRTELFMSERFEEAGFLQEFEKKTAYVIKDVLEFTDVFDLELFLSQKKKEASYQETFLVKTRNNRFGQSTLLYKTVGNQYVVLGDKIFVIHVVQSLKKTITRIQTDKKYALQN